MKIKIYWVDLDIELGEVDWDAPMMPRIGEKIELESIIDQSGLDLLATMPSYPHLIEDNDEFHEGLSIWDVIGENYVLFIVVDIVWSKEEVIHCTLEINESK